MKLHVILVLTVTAGFKDSCLGAKLERKQDYFDVESYENKRGYGLNEIGKRGFSSSLGFDYSPSSSSDYGIGSSGVITSDYSSTRGSSVGGGGGDEGLSPARDLIPPPAPSIYSSSTSPPSSSRSDYSKYGRLASSSTSTGKEFHSQGFTYHRSPISRRSPHLQRQSSSTSHNHHYFDDIPSSATSSSTSGTGSRSSRYNPTTFGLVSDPEGKLIGYRGSILPGFAESQSVPTSSISPDSSNFIGGYYPGPSSVSDHPKSKYSHSLTSSASNSGSRYTNTPVYYPGKEEDHSYRMRDSTSQGYEDDDISPSSEDNDFPIGGSTYQPSSSPFSHSHSHPYHLRDNDGLLGHSPGSSHHILEGSRFLPYGRDHPSSLQGFSYGPLGKNQRLAYDYPAKRSYGPPASTQSTYDSVERTIAPYGFPPLGYNDFGNTSPI